MTDKVQEALELLDNYSEEYRWFDPKLILHEAINLLLAERGRLSAEVRSAFFEGVRYGRSADTDTFWEEVHDEEEAFKHYQNSASGIQERHGLGTYDDGMVALGYRSGSSSDVPKKDKP